MGTMALIFPPLAVDGQLKIEMKALRVKSADPPTPFIILTPLTWVEFTLP